jgi:hypothetical protein
MSALREKRFRQLHDRIKISALKQDTVFPLEGIIRTFNGKRPLLKSPLKVMDFPYPYIHENPFPAKENLRNEVDMAFQQLMEEAAAFLE